MRPLLPVLLLGLLLATGCLGTGTRRMCVDSVTAGGGQATIQGEGATLRFSDPQGLGTSNWQGRGMYVITYDNNLLTQTLKAFTQDGACPILG
jgi:hypothetical protein